MQKFGRLYMCLGNVHMIERKKNNKKKVIEQVRNPYPRSETQERKTAKTAPKVELAFEHSRTRNKNPRPSTLLNQKKYTSNITRTCEMIEYTH